MGVPGPGGPCSEILYDRGSSHGPDFTPAELGPDMPFKLEDRLLEIWNLVFMQEELSAVRSKEDFDIVGPLPKQNIDTGMGLERVAFLLQGVDNMYEIDVMFPVIERAQELTGRTYGANHDDDVRFRVVADHVRSSLMLIGDGVTPGNEGRGYVLRRLMRRAIRSMRLLGCEDPVLPELLPVSRDKMGETYDGLIRDWERISTVAFAEEEAFRHTLRAGTTIFDTATAELKQAGGTELSAERAFALHDTFGFPIDLTLEMASEQGLDVDEVGFRRLMQEQRERAKADARAKKGAHRDATAYRAVADAMGAPVEFTGYSEVVSDGSVRGLVTADGVVDSVSEGDEVELVLDRTPFYAEGGGQLSDQGIIELSNGARLRVDDVQAPINGLIVHQATVLNGEVTPGLEAHSLVDLERRLSISRAHTATHMVHKAFREALGETATQAGSENAPGRFRFDFSAAGAVPESVMTDVEARVNDVILDDLAVHAEIMSQAEAVKSGAMALFGEKYGDEVRVVSVGEWARELCGGTHAGSSGKLGVIKLLGESSIGSGVRRVEALVGADAYRFLAREHVLVAQLSEALKARPEELPERVNDIVEKLRAAEKELEKVRVGQLLARAGELAAGAEQVGGIALVATAAPGAGGGDTRTLALDVRGRLLAGPARGRRRHRRGGRQGVGRRRGQRRGARPRRERQRAGPRGRPAGRRQGRRQGRRRPGRRHRRVPDRRGAGPGPRRGSQGLRQGVRIGLDPGDARIGVARSDPSGFLATPVETVQRGPGRPGPDRRAARRTSRTATPSGCWRWSSGCLAPSPAEKGRRPRRCGSGLAGWPGPWRRCRCGSPTSD